MYYPNLTLNKMGKTSKYILKDHMSIGPITYSNYHSVVIRKVLPLQ